MMEHRLSERLTRYWDTLRKDLPMPHFSHFNASAIEDIWQQCLLFTVAPEVENQPYALSFYQIGEGLRGLYGSNMLGRHFNSTQRHFQGAAIVRRVGEVLANPAPVNDMGQFVNTRSHVVKYRSCLLPFGHDKQVSHVITGLSWREF